MRIYKLYSIIIWSPDAVNPATPALADWAAPQHNNPFTPRKRPFPASLAHRPTSKILINYAIFSTAFAKSGFRCICMQQTRNWAILISWGDRLIFQEIFLGNNDLWNIFLNLWCHTASHLFQKCETFFIEHNYFNKILNKRTFQF